MLNLIVATLISLGFNPNCEHFTMNETNAKQIINSDLYLQSGGNSEFVKYVSIDSYLPNDIVICDDVDPKQ